MTLARNETNKPVDVLAERKRHFAEVSGRAATLLESSQQTDSVKLLQDAFTQAIDLIQALEVQAATPRNLHEHHHHDGKKDIRAVTYVAENHEHQPDHIVNHEFTAEVQTDRFYRLSTDLIVSTNGQFLFRPVSRKLWMTAAMVDLTEHEANRLLGYLKTDYGL